MEGGEEGEVGAAVVVEEGEDEGEDEGEWGVRKGFSCQLKRRLLSRDFGIGNMRGTRG